MDSIPIKELAAEHGMSCRKLAERFRIPYRTMEDWSAGRREPPAYVLSMMHKILENDRKTEEH